MESRKKVERVEVTELTNRFRSKDDLYRYLTQQGKCRLFTITSFSWSVFAFLGRHLDRVHERSPE
jgi:hypothetical protein